MSEPVQTHPLDPAKLGRLDPAGSTGFTRRSPIRRVSSEPILGLLLQRALVMEVAHAKVGAGVSHHSLFQSRPLTRAWSTADVGLRLVWGNPDTARAAANQVYRFHDHVNGELPESNPAWPQGSAYTAHDSSLLLWVWATLVDLMEVAQDRWIGPLDGDEAEALYRDHCTFAEFFGIPPEIIPADRVQFARYFETKIAGNELMPTPSSTAMVNEVLWYRNWNVPATAVRPMRVMAIGTMDRRIRERFGLELSVADQRLFDRSDRFLARWYRYRPASLFQLLPPLYVALRRPTVGWSKATGSVTA
ncbi:MAG TPA: oxygenase MpaB family protein [Acidimicrobiales bacterium]|nr:oxygenase MpaB family protein [Acidimicrobiales bacterium]